MDRRQRIVTTVTDVRAYRPHYRRVAVYRSNDRPEQEVPK